MPFDFTNAAAAATVIPVNVPRSTFARLHPAYGLPDCMRIAVLRDAIARGVQTAAAAANVSPSAVYRWRKAYTVADLMRR